LSAVRMASISWAICRPDALWAYDRQTLALDVFNVSRSSKRLKQPYS
jgi:hypothetical protein